MLKFDAGRWDLGKVGDICPNCDRDLAKRPGRKAKCKLCGEFIYVRTRPLDRKRVLVDEADAALLQRQWDLVSGALRHGADADSSVLEAELAEHAATNSWGLFRNTKLAVAGLADGRRDWRGAFLGYLSVCYLDVNGPCNGGPERFRLADARLAPAVVERLVVFRDWFGLSWLDARAEYLAVVAQLRAEFALPLSAEDGWTQLSRYLEEQGGGGAT